MTTALKICLSGPVIILLALVIGITFRSCDRDKPNLAIFLGTFLLFVGIAAFLLGGLAAIWGY